jgi:hypothetical protein
MATTLPQRLLTIVGGELGVINTIEHNVSEFDIVSYTWGGTVDAYDASIPGVNWKVEISKDRIDDIKRLMEAPKGKYETRYVWADCVCIDQNNEAEKNTEMAKMYEYYKSARMCHILLHMDGIWNPHRILNDLRFIDHILSYLGGAALAREARLTPNLTS